MLAVLIEERQIFLSLASITFSSSALLNWKVYVYVHASKDGHINCHLVM